jgi:hypothetical protein
MCRVEIGTRGKELSSITVALVPFYDEAEGKVEDENE